MYVLQNVAVALSAVSALAGIHFQQHSPAFWAAAVSTIAFGSLSSVGAQGSTLSVEKEWTATLSSGDSIAMAKLNAGKGSQHCNKFWCQIQTLVDGVRNMQLLCICNPLANSCPMLMHVVAA